MTTTSPEKILISACLLGLCTRYDGKIKEIAEVHKLIEGAICIPVCPEQLGGMPTPRPAADIHDGDGFDVLNKKAKVLTKDGEDCTAQFIAGAKEVLKIASLCGCSRALLKARSPSCAVTGTIGVTAALLQQKGVLVEDI